MIHLVVEYFLGSVDTYTIFDIMQTCARKELDELGVKLVVCVPWPASNFDGGL